MLHTGEDLHEKAAFVRYPQAEKHDDDNIFFSPPSNYFMNQFKYFLGDLITRYVVLMPVSKPGPLCFTNPLCKCVLEKQRTATHLRRGLVSFPRPVTS